MWTGLWIVLVTGSLIVFLLIGRSLWHAAKALLNELEAASDRLSAVSAELGAVTDPRPQEEPAVFADPTTLRQQRYLAAKAAGERERR